MFRSALYVNSPVPGDINLVAIRVAFFNQRIDVVLDLIVTLMSVDLLVIEDVSYNRTRYQDTSQQ